MTVFLTILTMLTLSWLINEIYINILIFVHGWTHNAPRIPKMYNIIGIWWIDQKLLTVKPQTTKVHGRSTSACGKLGFWKSVYLSSLCIYIYTTKSYIAGFLDHSSSRIYKFPSAETQTCGNIEGFIDLVWEFIMKYVTTIIVI